MSRQGITCKPIVRGKVRVLARHVRSRGFSLVSAIFLLVVLAGLGVAVVNISTVSQTSSALDVMGSRAYLAARAGVEWGLFRRLQAADRNAYCNDATAAIGVDPVAINSFKLSGAGTLEPFTVTVQCTYVRYHPNKTSFAANLAASGNIATGTAAGHGLSAGDQIIVQNAGSYNGTYNVETVTATTFSFLLTSSPSGGSTATITPRDQSLDRRRIRATACNQPQASEPQCPAVNPTSPDYVQRVVEVEF